MFVQNQKDTKKHTLLIQKLKKNTPNLIYPNDDGLFTIVLIKKLFEKKNSSRVGSRSQSFSLK